jgi:purine-binding chemotaxis protein CheW
MSAHDTVTRSQYLSFSVLGGDCAIPILQVKEILPYEAPTRVPSVPASIRGVINLRGTVVPVVDLAAKLGFPEAGVASKACILVVEAQLGAGRTVVGVMADAVREVLELAPDELEPPPTLGATMLGDFLAGLGKVGKRFVLLLDLDHLLESEEESLTAAAAAAEVPARPRARA